MASTFRTSIKNCGSSQQSADTRERVKRITSNLPEVYNKYFLDANMKDALDQNSSVNLLNNTQTGTKWTG